VLQWRLKKEESNRAAIKISCNSFTWIVRQYRPGLWKATTRQMRAIGYGHEWWNTNIEGNNVQNDHPWLLRDAHKQLFENRWSGASTSALVSLIMGIMEHQWCPFRKAPPLRLTWEHTLKIYGWYSPTLHQSWSPLNGNSNCRMLSRLCMKLIRPNQHPSVIRNGRIKKAYR